MSSNEESTGNSKFLKFIGDAFRIAVDIVGMAILFVILWKAGMNGELEVRGVTYHSPNVFETGFNWTIRATATGFASVLAALWHGDVYGVLRAIFWNVVSWETITFVTDTGFMIVITFIGYVLWRWKKLGGTMLVLGGLGLAWMLTMWGLQMLGPLLVPIPVGITLIALAIGGTWWAFKKLWSLGN